MKVSVIIPVWNAERWLPELLAAILSQQPAPPEEVILVDSMSRDRTLEIARRFERVRTLPITKFRHGRARNLGAREAIGELLVFLTQDALPANGRWLDRLIAPFEDPTVAAAYSRWLPRGPVDPVEAFQIAFHFPPGPPVVRRAQPGQPLDLTAVFFSNVSSAVRRSAWQAHPFDENLLMCEDQQLSRDLLREGHAIVYAADSIVLHSHHYTLSQTFRRYFDSAFALRQVFDGHTLGDSVRAGRRYLRMEARHMLRQSVRWWPYYAAYNAARALGTILGHRADRLPRSWVRRLSYHPGYWV
ncbi:MAG: glycosyltransferase [Kiritimatiellae bacterium]|nr:glycosyltransferase [Kiritimatiellia bacterium]